jgi:hydroxyethylthiazole kinase
MQGPGTIPHADMSHGIVTLLERLRARSPRVHCITNAVAQNFTANVLLAMGCVPSMTMSPEEVASFVSRTQALLVNLGTFDRERREATDIAVEAATQSDVPWVLDPVFVERAPPRAAFARELIARGPKVVRLNHAEFSVLAGAEPSREAAMTYARANGIVLGLSGATDVVTDGTRVATLANGHPYMAKVTAMGCAGSALVAACLAVVDDDDAWQATVAALVMLGIAGELAAATAAGPGSFAVAIIDALHGLDAATMAARARISMS